VNLEAIYVEQDEFSFEELLAKKRGLYGVKFVPRSPIENIFKPAIHGSPAQTVSQTEPTMVKTPPQPSPPIAQAEVGSNDDDEVAYVPLRGILFRSFD